MITKFGNAKIGPHGYYQITSSKEGNNGKKLHRLIYEDYHGYVAPTDEIHHLDGNPLNNDLSNLVAMDRLEHRRYHSTGENKKSLKNNPRIVKSGFREGKQTYAFKHDYKIKKRSVCIDTLLDFAKESGFTEVEVLGVMKKI